MASEKKIAGYVKALRKHNVLIKKYQAKLDKLEPLRRRRDAAGIAVKIKMQKMTGGELNAAIKIIAQPAPVVATTQTHN